MKHLEAHSNDPQPNLIHTHQEQRMNKQCYAKESTQSLNRSYCIESMLSEADHIVDNLNLEDIINKTAILEAI